MSTSVTCTWIDEHLIAFLQDTLESSEAHLVQRHLNACITCQRTIRILELRKAALSDSPDEPVDPQLEHRTVRLAQNFLSAKRRLAAGHQTVVNPRTIPLGLKTVSKSEWALDFPKGRIVLKDYDIEVSFQSADGLLVSAVLITDGDSELELKPRGLALVAGEHDIGSATGHLVFPDGRLVRFEVAESPRGTYALSIVRPLDDLAPAQVLFYPKKI
jgi:hypothetical protein